MTKGNLLTIMVLMLVALNACAQVFPPPPTEGADILPDSTINEWIPYIGAFAMVFAFYRLSSPQRTIKKIR